MAHKNSVLVVKIIMILIQQRSSFPLYFRGGNTSGLRPRVGIRRFQLRSLAGLDTRYTLQSKQQLINWYSSLVQCPLAQDSSVNWPSNQPLYFSDIKWHRKFLSDPLQLQRGHLAITVRISNRISMVSWFAFGFEQNQKCAHYGCLSYINIMHFTTNLIIPSYVPPWWFIH